MNGLEPVETSLPKTCSIVDWCFNVGWFESILEISQDLPMHHNAATLQATFARTMCTCVDRADWSDSCDRYTGPSGPPACPDALADVAEGTGARCAGDSGRKAKIVLDQVLGG